MEFSLVRPGIFTTQSPEADTTVSLVVGQKRCLLVDTGSSPQIGAQLREAVRQVTEVPLEVVVLTHGHWDHAFGLPAFTDLDTIGAEQVDDDLVCAENQAAAQRLGLSLGQPTLPTTRLALIGVRDLGGVTVELAFFGVAHSRSDLVIAVPERQTLIVGDLVEQAGPQFDETSSLDGWVHALDALYGLLREDSVIIPGHGQPLNPTQVAHFRTGLAAIWDQAEWAWHRQVPLDQVYDYDNLEWPWHRRLVETGIRLAYQELAARPQATTTPGLIGPRFTGSGLPISPV